MTTSMTTRPRTRLASALALVAALAVASAAPALARANTVLPASAAPHGYSLTKMASAVAPFTFFYNDPDLYPDTPFQVLYVDEFDADPVNGGIVATGGNSFTVTAGTTLYVPVFNASDEPPVLGTFPTTSAGAASYLFDPSLYGSSWDLIVDGKVTPLGPEYVAGPVAVEGTEFNFITLAAFVAPQSVGTHTITMSGGAYGAGLSEIHGISFVEAEFTYTVHVVPAG